MGKEKSLTIVIEESIYKQLEEVVEKRGFKLEDEVTEAIKAYIGRMRSYRNDPFFQIGKAGKAGKSDLKDLAKAHDEYLYGRKETK